MNSLCSIQSYGFHRPNGVAVVPVIPSAVSVNGLPVTFYPFTQNLLDYYGNTSTGVSDGTTFGTGCVYSATGGYKTGVGCIYEPTPTGGFLTNPLTYASGTAISFGGWLKITSTANLFLYLQLNGGSNRYYLTWNGGSGISLNWNGVGVSGLQNSNSTFIPSYTAGTWVHIIIVIPTSGNSLAYVNGTVVATPLTTATITPGAQFTNVNTILFGQNGPGASDAGSANNFYIFQRALSAPEVTALYNQ